jgi:hypothetical protein
MSAFTISLAKDADHARDMAGHLDPYLYEDELYGTLGRSKPKLTVGGLLLRLHRLEALQDQLAPAQAEAFAQAQADFDSARSDWATHYREKIKHELQARQRSFAWFLDDCDEKPKTCAGAYPVEAEKRTIIHHLLAEGEARGLDLAEEATLQAALDDRLRRRFKPGAFVWPAAFQPAYPFDWFWWLYGGPKQDT